MSESADFPGCLLEGRKEMADLTSGGDTLTNINSKHPSEIREIPMGNPMMAEYLSPSVAPAGNGNLPQVPNPKDLKVEQAPGLEIPAAGISSSNRNYMASYIFGTGLGATWSSNGQNGQPRNPDHKIAAPDPIHPPVELLHHRMEPSSDSSTVFKLDDKSSAESANSTPSGIICTRESSGNPLTGLGYRDDDNKTAKRYYEGTNSSQKLW